MDDTTDMVRAAWRLVRFYANESCGKCTPCREGASWLQRIYERILAGQGPAGGHGPARRRRLQHLARPVPRSRAVKPGDAPIAPFPYKKTTICDLGPSTVSPVMSTLRRFPRGVRGVHREERLDSTSRHRSTSRRCHEDHRRRPRGRSREGRAGHRRRRAGRRLHPPLLLPPADARRGHVPHVPGQRRHRPRARRSPRRASPRSPTAWSSTPQAPEVKKAQDGVLEFLLINHPLDCPVCDKGGECPLQDQTLHFGPGETRFVEEKRHYEKPIAISDLVLLDRERCILCDRCTRFSKEVAGDPLIHFIDRGNATQVNTFPDHPFASYFSGNVVQICPVGALDLDAVPVHGPAVGHRARREHVHVVRARLPGGDRVERQPDHPVPGPRLRGGQPLVAVRPGPVRLRVGQLRGPPGRARSCARATSWSRRRGARRWLPPARSCADVDRPSSGPRPSASSAAPG